MNDTAYHSVQDNKSPTMASPKVEIQKWLKKNEISFLEDMMKSELLELVRSEKPSLTYKIDRLFNEKRHDVLRLPPYHCNLNAIEYVWNVVKEQVARQTVDQNASGIKKIIENIISSISESDWEKAVGNVKKEESTYWETDALMEYEIENVVISFGGEETDIDSENASECSDHLSDGGEMSGVEDLATTHRIEMIDRKYTNNEEETEKIVIRKCGRTSDGNEDVKHQSSNEYRVCEEKEDNDNKSSCQSPARPPPPFELIECEKDLTMECEQPQPYRQQRILEKPENTVRHANQTLEKTQKQATGTTKDDVTDQLKKDSQEILNMLYVKQQGEVGGRMSNGSSSDQFAEVLIKEEVMLTDIPIAKNIYGEEGELPVVEIKHENFPFTNECSP